MNPQKTTQIVILLTLLVCGAAAPATKPAGDGANTFNYHHADVLGTALDLTVVAPAKSDADAAEKAVLDEVERLRLILSSYDLAAELAKLNATPRGGEGMKVSPELIDVLHQYETWNKRTGGAYSSAVMTSGGRDCQRIDQISTATNAACTRIARKSASLAPGLRPA